MDNDLANVGYSEVPPVKSAGTIKPNQEENPFPPSERPVYTVRQAEAKEAKGSGYKSLFIILFGVAAVAGILFAATYFNVPLPIGKTAVQTTVAPATPAGEGQEINALKVEVARTMQILDEMAAELSSQPEKLKKVEDLQTQTREILDSLGNSAP
ncbi:MAG: hypothetical protein ACE5EN_01260 [Nitrospinota bacterium]